MASKSLEREYQMATANIYVLCVLCINPPELIHVKKNEYFFLFFCFYKNSLSIYKSIPVTHSTHFGQAKSLFLCRWLPHCHRAEEEERRKIIQRNSVTRIFFIIFASNKWIRETRRRMGNVRNKNDSCSHVSIDLVISNSLSFPFLSFNLLRNGWLKRMLQTKHLSQSRV